MAKERLVPYVVPTAGREIPGGIEGEKVGRLEILPLHQQGILYFHKSRVSPRSRFHLLVVGWRRNPDKDGDKIVLILPVVEGDKAEVEDTLLDVYPKAYHVAFFDPKTNSFQRRD